MIYRRSGEVWAFCDLERKLMLMDAETFCAWIEQHVAPVKEVEDDDGVRSLAAASVGKTALGTG